MKKGVVLIELIVATLVLGMLIGFSIPNYRKFQSRLHQQMMINTLREMARYEKYSYLDSGRFFPKRIYDEVFEVTVYPDGTTDPDGVSLQSMLYRLPQERKHVYYIYWFAPVLTNEGNGDTGEDEGDSGQDEEDDDNGNDDNNDDDEEGDNGNGNDDEDDDNGHGNDDRDDEDDDNGNGNDDRDDDDDDDDDDKGGKKKGGHEEKIPVKEKNLPKTKVSVSTVSSEAYFCIYAYASKDKGNDLDGDIGSDVWYVDSYTDEPMPVSNDLE